MILEGAFCRARYSDHRMFCPRSIFSWWREVWLECIPVDARQEAELAGNETLTRALTLQEFKSHTADVSAMSAACSQDRLSPTAVRPPDEGQSEGEGQRVGDQRFREFQAALRAVGSAPVASGRLGRMARASPTTTGSASFTREPDHH